MGAFRTQVGLDLCGLEQLPQLLQGCWVACVPEGGRGGKGGTSHEDSGGRNMTRNVWMVTSSSGETQLFALEPHQESKRL